jgi:predicted TIM-barrel fold metal-dependent hydrolase
MLHGLDTRGVLLNLKTREQHFDEDDFRHLLQSYANRLWPLKWALQIFCASEQTDQVARILTTLEVPVIIDHLGSPHGSGGPVRSQPGYQTFIDLLKTGKVWKRLSGAYRFPNLPDIDECVLEILSIAPDRVIWASDWPHSGGIHANHRGNRKAMQEYRKIDDQAWVERCLNWCRVYGGSMGEELVREVSRDNAKTL